jgi:hypothetical protein
MSACHAWPAKLMSSEYPAYTWPYGARALMAEREKVQKVLGLIGQMNYGWTHGGSQPVLFQVPLTFLEGFVRNDSERITLTDRVRRYHNFNWKRDMSAKPNMNHGECGVTQSDRHYARLIDALLELQALTEELKPETLVLMSTCAGGHELQQAMLNARDSAYPGLHRQLDEVD